MKPSHVVLALVGVGIILLAMLFSPNPDVSSVADKDVAGAEALPIIVVFFLALAALAFGMGRFIWSENIAKK